MAGDDTGRDGAEAVELRDLAGDHCGHCGAGFRLAVEDPIVDPRHADHAGGALETEHGDSGGVDEQQAAELIDDLDAVGNFGDDRFG